MKKPVLVIMAAGMGSRYGGLKQIDPVDAKGRIIMDFSIFDAKRAGFEKVIFIIKKEQEDLFREAVGDRVSEYMEVSYAYQEINNIPAGFQVPEGRVKPWGTAHAVYSCKDMIDGPFAVINADDYYGREAFQLIYDYLNSHEDDDKFRYTMVGYKLCNTVTENGYVSRGVCEMNEAGELIGIRERTRIEHHENGIAFTEDDGATPKPAEITVKIMIHLNVWNPILPTSCPSPPPTAEATADITSSTTDIWISLIKISPINFRLEAHSPTSAPNTIPPAVAISI